MHFLCDSAKEKIIFWIILDKGAMDHGKMGQDYEIKIVLFDGTYFVLFIAVYD